MHATADLLGQVPSPESLCSLDQHCPPSWETLKGEIALMQCNGVLSIQAGYRDQEISWVFWRIHVCAKSLQSCRLFVMLWTVAPQAPLSWDSPGKNTGAGCQALLQGTFPTQRLNPVLMAACIEKEGSWPLGPPEMLLLVLLLLSHFSRVRLCATP